MPRLALSTRNRLDSREKSITKMSNMASARTTNSSGDADVEPGGRVDRAERAGGENHDQAEHAVDQRHRAAVGRAEQEPALPRSRLRAGADDGQVDRDHRQHARREIEREAAGEHDDENRRGAAPSNQPFSVTPVSALRMNFRKSSVPRYPRRRSAW